jgi:hypothetical protein
MVLFNQWKPIRPNSFRFYAIGGMQAISTRGGCVTLPQETLAHAALLRKQGCKQSKGELQAAYLHCSFASFIGLRKKILKLSLAMSPSPSLPLHNFMNGQTPTSEACNKKSEIVPAIQFYAGRMIANPTQYTTVEDYLPGYPRYTALLSAHDPFLICRRFTRLRARLLLLKQDRLSQLEAKLDELDQNEKFPLFLGVSRRDANSERAALVAEIDSQLEDYGAYKVVPGPSL